MNEWRWCQGPLHEVFYLQTDAHPTLQQFSLKNAQPRLRGTYNRSQCLRWLVPLLLCCCAIAPLPLRLQKLAGASVLRPRTVRGRAAGAYLSPLGQNTPWMHEAEQASRLPLVIPPLLCGLLCESVSLCLTFSGVCWCVCACSFAGISEIQWGGHLQLMSRDCR